jgi:chromate transporter
MQGRVISGTSRQDPSAGRVFWVLLKLGAVAFGGLGATLGLLDRELVTRRGWLTATDVRDALAYTKPLPGSTVVQVVTFLGWRLARLRGALAATVGFLIPAAALMTAAAAGAAALPDARWVHGALLGLHVAVVGLLAHAMIGLLRKEARSIGLAMVASAAAIAGFFVNVAVVIAVAGLVGVAADKRRRRSAPERTS